MGEPAQSLPQPAPERPRFVAKPNPLKGYYSLRDRLTMELTERCERELEKVLAGKRITEGDKLVLISCLRGIMCVGSPGQALKCLQQYHELRDEILDRLDVREHGQKVREELRRENAERQREREREEPAPRPTLM